MGQRVSIFLVTRRLSKPERIRIRYYSLPRSREVVLQRYENSREFMPLK
jgi:hypothetical protein